MGFKHLCIDGDSLLYRCGYAAEKEPVENAIHNLKNSIGRIEADCGCKLENFVIKGKGNFREEIAVSAPYKGHRLTPPPKHYDAMRAYLVKTLGSRVIEVDGMEADDWCSAWLYCRAVDYPSHREISVIAALDKDLWNTPGWHYNYATRVFTFVTTKQADMNFITQMLTGDASDNIPGLPEIFIDGKWQKVGPVRAKRFLAGKSVRDALTLTYCAYRSYGDGLKGWTEDQVKEYFLEQGQLLWMTREMDSAGKPVLWTPPKWLFESV